MASKHDAKRARENFWVMQQNMARDKGRAHWMQRLPKPSFGKPVVTKVATATAVDETPAPAAVKAPVS